MRALARAHAVTRNRLAATAPAGVLLLAGIVSATPSWSEVHLTTAAPVDRAIIVRASIAPGIGPGDRRTVRLTASNTGSSAIAIRTVRLVDISADGGHPDCATDDFRMADVPQRASVPAGADSYPLASGTLVYHDTETDQNGCQGVTLTLTLTSLDRPTSMARPNPSGRVRRRGRILNPPIHPISGLKRSSSSSAATISQRACAGGASRRRGNAVATACICHRRRSATGATSRQGMFAHGMCLARIHR